MYGDVEVLDLVSSRSSTGGTPVFVDPHGRRARWTSVAGRVAGGATVLYLVLVVASLVGAPWVPRVGLPSVGPAPRTVHTTSAVTLPASAPRQAPPILGHPATGSTPTTAVTGARSSVVSTSPVTSAHTAVTTAAPGQTRTSTTTTPLRSVPTTTPPGRSGTAPGKH